MMVSWVNVGICINILCIGAYMFVDTRQVFWSIFFSIISYLINIFLCLVIFKACNKGLTNKELSGVMFLGIYKTLCIGFLVYGLIFGKISDMYENISFIIFIGLAGGLAWFMSKPIYGKLYEK